MSRFCEVETFLSVSPDVPEDLSPVSAHLADGDRGLTCALLDGGRVEEGFMPTIVFGPFQLDTRSLELRKDGRQVRLRPQPCRLLALLALRANELVTREELRQTLWPAGVYVRFDLGLNSCLKQIRRALGESAEVPGYIETLTRRGYRFLGPVEITPDVPRSRGLTIAVLPFEAIDASSAIAAPLAEGLAEDLTVSLARCKRYPLTVIDRSAVLDLVTGRPAARWLRVLGVEYFVEGRVRASDGRLRLTAKLLTSAELSHVWAGTYDAALGNPFDAQDDIVKTLTADLCRVLARLEEEESPSPDSGRSFHSAHSATTN